MELLKRLTGTRKPHVSSAPASSEVGTFGGINGRRKRTRAKVGRVASYLGIASTAAIGLGAGKWESGTEIAEQEGINGSPKIHWANADEGTMVFGKNMGGANFDLLCRFTADGGKTWTEATPVTTAPADLLKVNTASSEGSAAFCADNAKCATPKLIFSSSRNNGSPGTDLYEAEINLATCEAKNVKEILSTDFTSYGGVDVDNSDGTLYFEKYGASGTALWAEVGTYQPQAVTGIFPILNLNGFTVFTDCTYGNTGDCVIASSDMCPDSQGKFDLCIGEFDKALHKVNAGTWVNLNNVPDSPNKPNNIEDQSDPSVDNRGHLAHISQVEAGELHVQFATNPDAPVGTGGAGGEAGEGGNAGAGGDETGGNGGTGGEGAGNPDGGAGGQGGAPATECEKVVAENVAGEGKCTATCVKPGVPGGIELKATGEANCKYTFFNDNGEEVAIFDTEGGSGMWQAGFDKLIPKFGNLQVPFMQTSANLLHKEGMMGSSGTPSVKFSFLVKDESGKELGNLNATTLGTEVHIQWTHELIAMLEGGNWALAAEMISKKTLWTLTDIEETFERGVQILGAMEGDGYLNQGEEASFTEEEMALAILNVLKENPPVKLPDPEEPKPDCGCEVPGANSSPADIKGYIALLIAGLLWARRRRGQTQKVALARQVAPGSSVQNVTFQGYGNDSDINLAA